MQGPSDLSDGDDPFWDLQGDGPKAAKTSRRRPLAGATTPFPSLSVYISCQELEPKEGPESGNKVSISIPDIANVSELRIKEQVEESDDDDDVSDEDENASQCDGNEDGNLASNSVTTEECNGTIDAQGSSSKSIDDEENGSDEEEGSSEHSEKKGEEEHSFEDDIKSESEENDVYANSEDVAFFNNCERVDAVDKSSLQMSRASHKRPKKDKRKGGKGAVSTTPASISHPPHQLLKHWLYRGRKLLVACDGPMAVDAFVRAFALARIVHGTSHWRAARCKVFLARSYLYIFNYPLQAIIHSSEACDVINDALSTCLELNKKPQVHHTLSWAYLVHGEAKLVEKIYQATFPILSRSLYHAKQFDALTSQRKKLKPSMQLDNPSDLVLKILCSQAKLLEVTNNIYKARGKLEEGLAVATRTRDAGLRDAQDASLLKALGKLLLRHAGKTQEGGFTPDDAHRDREEGVRCLRRSLEIIQKRRPGSMKECELRFILAKHNLKHDLETPRAIWWELHKLKIWSSRVYGEHSERARAIQECLVQVLVKERRFDEAATELREILSSIQSSLGEYNAQVCAVLRQLSNLYLTKKEPSNALMALCQCLSVEVFVFGNSSRRVQLLRLKIKDLLLQVPMELRKKVTKKHPELQQKPPFRYYC